MSLVRPTNLARAVNYYVDTVHYNLICGRCPLYSRTVPGADPATSRRTRQASPRRGPRPRGTVRAALIEAGLELARAGGPDAVVLREVTRMVGVVPNAAYRHFADRDAFLAAVRDAAVGQLAQRMAAGMRRVCARSARRISSSLEVSPVSSKPPSLRPRTTRSPAAPRSRSRSTTSGPPSTS